MYQLSTGHYLCRNKYYGRGLSSEGFRHALYQYLHNGKGLRQDLFEPILNKLHSLKAVLERQASYRFYSSSLLIIYEGKVRLNSNAEGEGAKHSTTSTTASYFVVHTAHTLFQARIIHSIPF